MKKNSKVIPKFKSEKEEDEFWQKNDSSQFINWSEVKNGIFPDLKPSTNSISLRLPLILLSRIKNAANKRDIPYQSFIKMMLSDRIEEIEKY